MTNGGRVSLALAALLAACDPPADAPDASSSADAPGSTNVQIPWLAAGEPPVALPIMTPCPDGWREVVDASGVTVCDPSPEGGAPACEGFSQWVPGTTACRHVGSDCPADGVPTPLPSTGVLHVRADASAGGDGSLASPFATIGSAIAAASSGTTIAIHRGSYVESVRVPRGVTLQGACVDDTVLSDPSSGSLASVIQIDGLDVAIRDLRIGASGRWGIAVPPGSRAAIVEGVIIEGTRGLGITLGGGSIELRRSIIRDVVADASGRYGYGIDVENGATATLDEVDVVHTTDNGLFAAGAGSTLRVIGSRVTDIAPTTPRGSEYGGLGIAVQRGGRLEIERTLIDRANEVGVSVLASEASLTDVVIRDTNENVVGVYGRGLGAQDDASVVASRLLIEGSQEIGVVASRSATIELTDLVVRDARSSIDVDIARGLHAQSRASIRASRVLIRNVIDVGVFAHTADIEVSDLRILGLRSSESETWGARAINIEDGSNVTVTRARIDFHSDDGIVVLDTGAEPTTGLFEDVLLQGPAEGPRDDAPGIGLASTANTTLRRVVVRDSTQIGMLFTVGEDLTGRAATLEDVVVQSTHVGPCDATAPECQTLGVGLAFFGVEATAQRFDSLDNELCGVLVGPPIRLAITSGRATGNAVGLCVLGAEVDTDSITAGLALVGNDTAFQLTGVTRPQPPTTIGLIGE